MRSSTRSSMRSIGARTRSGATTVSPLASSSASDSASPSRSTSAEMRPWAVSGASQMCSEQRLTSAAPRRHAPGVALPMDLTDTTEAAAFRVECRAWLTANATPRPTGAAAGVTGVLGSDIDTSDALARARAYQARAAADGWAAISWPRTYGGRDASSVEQVVFAAEASQFDVPDHVFRIGIMMGGPTVIAHGTGAQRTRWLRPLLTGEEIWCQLFSEPGAGSDLASLSTSAA